MPARYNPSGMVSLQQAMGRQPARSASCRPSLRSTLHYTNLLSAFDRLNQNSPWFSFSSLFRWWPTVTTISIRQRIHCTANLCLQAPSPSSLPDRDRHRRTPVCSSRKRRQESRRRRRGRHWDCRSRGQSPHLAVECLATGSSATLHPLPFEQRGSSCRKHSRLEISTSVDGTLFSEDVKPIERIFRHRTRHLPPQREQALPPKLQLAITPTFHSSSRFSRVRLRTAILNESALPCSSRALAKGYELENVVKCSRGSKGTQT